MVTIDRSTRTVRWGLSITGIALFLSLWFLATSVFELWASTTMPSPLDVVSRYAEFTDLLIENTWPTLTASVVGFVSAAILAIGIGTILTMNDSIQSTLMPIIVGGNTIPRVALAPVIIFYVGGGEVANYVIAAWIAFFPMLVNTIEGLSDIDEDYEKLLKNFDASLVDEYRHFRFPNALPFIFDGMKISVSLAVVGAVVGEYVSGTQGLGYLALIALSNYDMALVFAVVGITGVFALVMFFGLFLLQDKLVFWDEASLFSE